jgi:N-acetylglucosamine kinase-like BadF-type ATPase
MCFNIMGLVRSLRNSTRYVAGVDGGASKTVAIIGNQTGEVLGMGKSGSSNYHNITAPEAGRAVKKAIYEAKREAGIVGKPVEIAVVALAGMDSPRDSLIGSRFVRKTKVARHAYVVHDSIAALYAVTHGEPSVIVISGTGSVSAGINSTGRYARSGGYGYLISDEGSAFEIGKKALVAAFQAIDGRAPPTRLVSILKRSYRVKRLENALSKIYSKRLSVEQMARLAPLVARAASSDEVCRRILTEAGTSLAELACAVARRLKMTDSQFTVAIAGGNFKAGRKLLGPFKARIRQECPRARFAATIIEPAMGALALAVSALDKVPTETRLLNV